MDITQERVNLLVLHCPLITAEDSANLEYFRERLIQKSGLCNAANFEFISYQDFVLFYNGFELKPPKIPRPIVVDSSASTAADSSEAESQSLSCSVASANNFVENNSEKESNTAENSDGAEIEVIKSTKPTCNGQFTSLSLRSYSGILALDFDNPHNRLAEGTTSAMASAVPCPKDEKEKRALLKSLRTLSELLKDFVAKEGGLLFMDGSSGRRSFDFAQEQFQLSWFSGVVPDMHSIKGLSSAPPTTAHDSVAGAPTTTITSSSSTCTSITEVNPANSHITAMLPDVHEWLDAFKITGGSYLAGASEQEAVISLKGTGTAPLCEMALKSIDAGVYAGVFAMFQGPCTERWVKMFLQLAIGVSEATMQNFSPMKVPLNITSGTTPTSPPKRTSKTSPLKKSASKSSPGKQKTNPARTSSGLLKVTPVRAQKEDDILQGITQSISAKKATDPKKKEHGRKCPSWVDVKVMCPGLLEFENLNAKT